jgi:hypothetical protein
MNAETAASAEALPAPPRPALDGELVPHEAKAADPVPTPSTLRKSLLSTVTTLPSAGHDLSRYHGSTWLPQRSRLTEPNADYRSSPPQRLWSQATVVAMAPSMRRHSYATTRHGAAIEVDNGRFDEDWPTDNW